jgi:hypothetical protein
MNCVMCGRKIQRCVTSCCESCWKRVILIGDLPKPDNLPICGDPDAKQDPRPPSPPALPRWPRTHDTDRI